MPQLPISWLRNTSIPSPMQMRMPNADVRWEFEKGKLVLYTPYDEAFLHAFKAAIPYTDRGFKRNPNRWEVLSDYAEVIHDLCYRFFAVDLQLPPSLPGKVLTVETRLLEVRYIGRVKAREDGSQTATGYCNGEWSVIFPKAVLLNWFGATDRPGESTTLHSVLGITTSADSAAIKSAYRRLARQWHPDVCGEPDAQEQFLKIQRAYEILSDPVKAAKYRAGLALEMSLKDKPQRQEYNEYQPPLRCGLILANGVDRLGRFIVESIEQWEDIRNRHGQILVSSWVGEQIEERWVEA